MLLLVDEFDCWFPEEVVFSVVVLPELLFEELPVLLFPFVVFVPVDELEPSPLPENGFAFPGL
mgnify:CR=1 FL=1